MGWGPSCLSWMARGSTDGWEIESPNNVPRGTTVEVGESIVGVDYSSRIPWRRIVELAVRIGRRPLRILADSRSTGNSRYARECVPHGIKSEGEDQLEELKIAHGTVVRTEGRV